MAEIAFGPAGNSEEFYAQGHKHTYEEPEWIHSLGLSAFEYSFGRGAKLNEDTGEKIRIEAEKYNIRMSVHAPYYINLANDAFDKNLNYFLQSSICGSYMGAKRVIIHPGSTGKQAREIAFEKTKNNLKEIINHMKREGFSNLKYCLETMGKMSQLGSLEEIIELCAIDEMLYPAIDFGHLNTRTLGGISEKKDYAKILDALKNGVGEEKYKNFHAHFSHIEYSAKGEVRHLTFEDTHYGPFFEPLAELLAERDLSPIIICESNGTQALDAATMKEMYEARL